MSEVAGTRRLDQGTIQGESTFAAEQAFVSPPGEHLFGTGEFQDGFLDVRDLPRRLTQVNSQIAIPFLLSSRGYGILWHNYGLTDLNPADERVLLTRTSTGSETTASVTTAEGARREIRREGEFAGSLEIPRDGRYAFMLDVGKRWPAGTMLRSTERSSSTLPTSGFLPRRAGLAISLRAAIASGLSARKMTIRYCFGGAPTTARYCALL